MRINSPADDPTGLVLSSNLNSEIRTLAQAMQNAQDGINLLHTGIDSLQTMESTLLKLKELTEKAANGTYSASERQEMQKQANELLKSLYTTKNTTSFGQINIFGSKLGSASAPSTPSVASYVNYAAFMYNTPSSVGSSTNDGSSYERYEIKTTSSSKTLSASPPAYAPSSTSASSPVSAASDTSSSEIVLIRSEQEFIDKIAQDGTGTEGKTYVLNNDLDFSTISNYVAKENFSGTIIGNGHTIKNLTSDQGLFASTEDSSSISGLTLDNFTITASGNNTGSLVGNNRGDIDDVHVINSTINGGSYQNIGGLAGYSYNATISNSSSSATVSGGNHVGGLVGSSYATITNSYSTGDATGTEDVGGLAGSTSGDISNSYATGNVSGTDKVGGLAGNHSTGSTISNSYATGDVTGTSSVGGLTGVTLPYAVIENSYATGTVTGTEYVGALAGLYGGVITNSFYNKETAGVSSASGTGSSYGVTGLTSSQFSTSTPFVNAGWSEADWDFTIDGPHLVWENYEPAGSTIHISSAQEFIDKIAQNGADTEGKTYVLDNDIDFSTISNYVAKENFSGTIIGNGHTIKNLTSDQGLFASTEDSSSISGLTLDNFTITASGNNTGSLVGNNRGDIDDVHVINSTINGGSYQNIGGLAGYSYNATISNSSSSATVSGGNHVGGLVGSSYATITNSYSTGDATGTEDVGGLAGSTSGDISNSYATGNVSGTDKVGGLAGNHSTGSTISNSYATGDVTGTSSVGGLTGVTLPYAVIENSYATGTVTGTEYVGALAGLYGGVITNSFYNKETAGVSSALGSGSSYGVTGLTGSQFATSTPFVNAGWDETIWDFTVDGPHLALENYEPAPTEIHITSAQEFIDKIAQDGTGTAGRTYILDNDIDFSTISNYVAKENFSGTIIGNGHTIKNLTSDQGLFASTEDSSSISGLTLDNFTITASGNNTGSLVGNNRGDIDDVHVINSTINGGSYQNIGGLAGYSYNATISNSSSSATVSGGNHVGGLVGSSYATITNSYSTGDATGTEDVGGLAGSTSGDISNSYATGNVSGTDKVGGLAGNHSTGSTISNSYATGDVTGTSSVGGLTGVTLPYAVIENSYATGTVTGTEYVGALAGLYGGVITNSFYNKETAGVSSALGSGSSYGVTGLTGSQFATSTPFVNAGWDEAIWDFTIDGPHLVWENYEPAGSTIHISSAQEFIDKIAQDGTGTEGKTYVLDNDIDFSTISNYVAKENFAGTFLGNGHTIKNLTSEQGLFVTTTNTASISDLTLENFTITASENNTGALVGVNRGDIDDVHVINATINGGSYQDIGGLIGNNQSGDISNSSADVTITGDGGMYGGLVGQVVNGTITNSSSSGSISGNSVVGGLIGDFSSGGSASITNSYSTADVTGNTAVGGFIGYMSIGGGSVADSYSSGNVNGNSSAENIGGFVGDMNSGTLTNVYAYGEVNTDSTNNVGGFAGKITGGSVTNSFWNTTAAGTTAVGNGSSSGMTGLSEKEFSAHNFAADGWDTSIWDFNEARPHLKTENYLPPTAGGTGVGQISAEEAEQLGYILIWNFNDFIDKIAQDGSGTAGKTYILMNDINMSSLSDYKAKENFSGTFLGNGYTIKNLTSGGGLFSSTTADAEIKDVTLDNFNVEANASNTGILVDTNAGNIENVNITNSNITTGNAAVLFSSVGGLAGTSSGTISNSSVDVDIDGAFDAVGGLIGHNTGTITGSMTSGTITGAKNYQVGGLVGENDGTITGSSSTVDVEGHTNIGGLIGLNNSGSISDSHAEGNVSGNSAGGLIGNNNGGTIDNSYATGNVEGSDKTGGLIGVNSGTITDSHAEGDVTGTENTGGLIGQNSGSTSTITNSYATGNVEGTENTGGLIGLNNYATITGSYAEGSVNGKTNTGGLIGRNIAGTISNSHATGRVESSGENTGGLVGWNNGAGIITNSYAAGNVEGRDKSGGLVGSNEGSTIENSYATGNVNQTNVMTSIIGGLVGYNSGTITGSHAEGNVSGQIGVGGLVGSNYATITNSYSTGDIFGQTSVGGFSGANHGIIENSYATGDVEGSDNAGGFAGVNYGTITGSYAEGAVSGYSAIGGFVGVNSTTASGNGEISDSYSIGTVTGIAGGSGNIGGFVGNMTYGTFTNVYSYGAVNLSATNTGGFAGTITGGSVANSFWNTTAAGMTGVSSGASTGLTGLTTQDFMNMNNFVGAGWNDTIWNLTQGNPRPHLEWENYVGPGVDPGDEGDPDFDGYPDTPGSGGQSGSYPTDPGNNDAKTEVVLQIGTDNDESSRWTIDTSLDFDDIWINLSNSDTARISLESIDNALATVREKIASFSTTADILKSSIETSEAKSENLEAAKSTILDADIAAEMVELMKAKRQFELSNTMLIQAGNIQYNQAMALIEGLNFASSGQEVQNSLNNIQHNGREHQSILNSIQNNNIYHQSILDVVADNNAKNNIMLKMINKYK